MLRRTIELPGTEMVDEQSDRPWNGPGVWAEVLVHWRAHHHDDLLGLADPADIAACEQGVLVQGDIQGLLHARLEERRGAGVDELDGGFVDVVDADPQTSRGEGHGEGETHMSGSTDHAYVEVELATHD